MNSNYACVQVHVRTKMQSGDVLELAKGDKRSSTKIKYGISKSNEK